MKRSRLLRLIAALTVLSLGAVACGDDDDSTTSTTSPSGGGGEGQSGEGCDDSLPTIKVGSVTTAQNYAGMEDAIVARIERENQTCIQGRKLEFVGSRDDAGDVQKNLDGAKDLVENGDADLLLITSDRTVQTPAYLAQQRVPFFGWGFMPGFCGDDAWGFSANGCLSGWAFAQMGAVQIDDPPLPGGFSKEHEAIVGKDDYTLVVIQEDSEAGRAGGKLYDELWDDDQLLANEYLPAKADGSVEPAVLTQAVQLVNDKNPDLVMLSTPFAMAVALSAAIKASGYEGKIQTFVSYAPGLLEASPDLADAFEGTYTIVQYPTVEEGGADAIRADLEAAGKEGFVTLGAMIGWWNMDLAIELMKAVDGEITGESIRETAMNGFSYEPEGGPSVDFPDNLTGPGHDGCQAAVAIKNKAYEVVRPYQCYKAAG